MLSFHVKDMPFSIRRMKKSDLEEILSIEKKSFLSPWSRTAFENEIQADYSYPLILTSSNSSQTKILGYLICWLILDECHILNLSVHADYQRKGLASRLIKHLFEFCQKKGVSHLYLEVRTSNQKAIALYKKYGFEIYGQRKRYYTDTGEDALLMQRRNMCL